MSSVNSLRLLSLLEFRRATTILLCLLCMTFSATLYATDWYVDKAATGTNNGTSLTNAWTTVAAVTWGSIVSGDTLWIKGANYNENFTIDTGSTKNVLVSSVAHEHEVTFGHHVLEPSYGYEISDMKQTYGAMPTFASMLEQLEKIMAARRDKMLTPWNATERKVSEG